MQRSGSLKIPQYSSVALPRVRSLATVYADLLRLSSERESPRSRHTGPSHPDIGAPPREPLAPAYTWPHPYSASTDFPSRLSSRTEDVCYPCIDDATAPCPGGPAWSFSRVVFDLESNEHHGHLRRKGAGLLHPTVERARRRGVRRPQPQHRHPNGSDGRWTDHQRVRPRAVLRRRGGHGSTALRALPHGRSRMWRAVYRPREGCQQLRNLRPRLSVWQRVLGRDVRNVVRVWTGGVYGGYDRDLPRPHERPCQLRGVRTPVCFGSRLRRRRVHVPHSSVFTVQRGHVHGGVS